MSPVTAASATASTRAAARSFSAPAPVTMVLVAHRAPAARPVTWIARRAYFFIRLHIYAFSFRRECAVGPVTGPQPPGPVRRPSARAGAHRALAPGPVHPGRVAPLGGAWCKPVTKLLDVHTHSIACIVAPCKGVD